MDTLQQFTNSESTTRKAVDKWLSDNSTKILHRYMFDKPYYPNLTKYVIIDAMRFMLCADMDCDFSLCESTLEKITKYASNGL